MDFLRNIDGLLTTFQSFELSLCSLKNRAYAYVLIPVSQYSSINIVTAYRLEDSVRFQIDVGIFSSLLRTDWFCSITRIRDNYRLFS
jgi:hypothetical protein